MYSSLTPVGRFRGEQRQRGREVERQSDRAKISAAGGAAGLQQSDSSHSHP